MNDAYLVTEGKPDSQFLQRLLPDRLRDRIGCVPGGGRSSAISLATTLLGTRQRPVALVLDSNTLVESVVREQQGTLEFLLGGGAGATPFQVFQAVPSLEIALVEDDVVFRQLLGEQFSPLERKFALRDPKGFLQARFPERVPPLDEMLARLDDEGLDRIRSHSLVQELTAFFSGVLDPGTAPSRNTRVVTI